MKLSILGAGAMRTPLLIHGLVNSDLPIAQIDLYDLDEERLECLFPVMQAVAGNVLLCRKSSSESAIQGSDFVLVSLRVGGMAQRSRDEQIALSHNILGQETVGPVGFAKAWRTVPAVLEYARQVELLAPRAFLINFSNPVGIVTQAVTSQSQARMIGICDTPTELFEETARLLGVPSQECFFDFFGLNHLGWLRQVYYRGEPQMARLLEQPQKLYRAEFFSQEWLRDLNLLPTEYGYFYYHPERALAEIKKAGKSRGSQLEELNAELLQALKSGGPPLQLYERYLATRNSTYMQGETGCTPRCNSLARLGAEVTGYDKIALSVIRSIHLNLGRLIPLNVANRGNIPELRDEDSIEVPCVVDSNGAHPVHVGKLPESVRALVCQVKDYERRTVQAALSQNRSQGVEALARNPLVPSRAAAESLVDQLLP